MTTIPLRDARGRFTHRFHGPGVTAADNDGRGFDGGPAVSPLAATLRQLVCDADTAGFDADNAGDPAASDAAYHRRDRFADLLDADPTHRWNWRTPGQVRLTDLDDLRATLPGSWILVEGRARQVRTVRRNQAGTWLLRLDGGQVARFAQYSTLDWTQPGQQHDERIVDADLLAEAHAAAGAQS